MQPRLVTLLRTHVASLVAVLALASPAFAAPQSKGATLKFASAGYARMPFDLRTGHVWVRGTVGKSDSLWICVDSGAGGTLMDATLARSLGFTLGNEHVTFGAGGRQPAWTVEDVTIGLPGVTLHRERMDASELRAISGPAGRPMNVIVGYELFAKCVVRFDYAAGVLELWEAGAKSAPRDGERLKMTLSQNHPYVDGTLTVAGREPLAGRFVIDTGSSAALILSPEVIASANLKPAFPRTIETLSRGVGGERHSWMGRAESFALGSLRFERPIVALPDSGPGRISAPGTLGNIGGPLLSRCRVTFDYPRSEVRFEPAAAFGRPFEADMCGATFTADSSGWSVRIVNPGTPAEEAGLRVGDTVTSVDGVPAGRLEPAALRELMKQEGRSIPIGIRRDDRDSTITVVLRRLV